MAGLLEVDRFLVPREPRILRYFVDRLFVAHGRGERIRGEAARRGGPRVARLLLPRARDGRGAATDLAAAGGDGARLGPWQTAGSLLASVRTLAAGDPVLATALDAALGGRAILLRDYETADRAGVLLFPFDATAAEPLAVVKIRRDEGGQALRAERDAMVTARHALPAELAATVPAALGYRSAPGLEVLVISHLPGRSAYVEMRNARRPAERLEDHFTAAAEWLAGFHVTTRGGGRVTLEDGADEPWVADLKRRLGRRPVQTSMAHGDFWSRNLLLPPATGRPPTDAGLEAAVVDWEHFRSEASPLDDLFQFPLTYGWTYRWDGYAAASPATAFRGTFLEDTPVARSVSAYLRRYCSLTGLDPALLRPFLRLDLRRRARTAQPGLARELHACESLLAEHHLTGIPHDARARPDQ